jgi:hypothetical protein
VTLEEAPHPSLALDATNLDMATTPDLTPPLQSKPKVVIATGTSPFAILCTTTYNLFTRNGAFRVW